MKSTTKDLVFIALSTTIFIVCTFITVPFYVPFTMQTFALFTIIGLLGTKRACIAVTLYLLLGIIGLPVFSGFRGGLGILLGVTGGYLIGFLLTAFLSGTLIKLIYKNHKSGFIKYFICMGAGLCLCYLFGTLWYLTFYTNSAEPVSAVSVLSVCVFPFVLPDIAKIVLSYYVVRLLKKHITAL